MQNWTENWRKSCHCPRKPLKVLQKAWSTAAQDHFRKFQQTVAPWVMIRVTSSQQTEEQRVCVHLWGFRRDAQISTSLFEAHISYQMFTFVNQRQSKCETIDKSAVQSDKKLDASLIMSHHKKKKNLNVLKNMADSGTSATTRWQQRSLFHTTSAADCKIPEFFYRNLNPECFPVFFLHSCTLF